MADKNLKFTLDFIAKTAGLKDSAQLAEKLGAKLDDSSDSADALAKVMAATADKLEAELKETTQIAELLGNALGPEMAAKIGQANLDKIAGEFRAAGLDAKGAEEKIDQLADGVRRLDQVADSAGTLDTKIKDVGKSTDQSRSVMANFTGNAIQELPGMTGMFGPLNMAVGQFGEYAAEGNIKLGQMAQMAGPMLGVTVAMKLLTDYMKQVAAVKAFNKAEVKAFADSLREGSNVAKDFHDRLEEIGKVEFHLNRLFGGDALGAMAEAGLTMDQFSKAVFGGKDGLDKLSEGLKAANVDGATIVEIMAAATTEQDNYSAAVKLSAELDKVFGDTADDVAKVGVSWWEVVAGSDGAAAATDRARLASERLALVLGQLDDDEALLNLQQQFDDVKAKAEADYKAVAEGSMSAEEATRNHELALIDLKKGVADYAIEVLGLPAEQVSKIVAEMTDANADDIERRLTVLARTRMVNLVANVVGPGSSARPGDIAHNARGTNSARPGLSWVGEEGPELVSFKGGEQVIPAAESAAIAANAAAAGQTIEAARAAADALAQSDFISGLNDWNSNAHPAAGGSSSASSGGGTGSGSGGSVTFYNTFNSVGMSAEQIVRALEEWVRRNGALKLGNP